MKGVSGAPYVVILQSDHFDQLTTRLVAPVYRADVLPPLDELTPHIEIDGDEHVVRIDLSFAAPKSKLGPKVGSAVSLQQEVMRAIDRLLTGF